MLLTKRLKRILLLCALIAFSSLGAPDLFAQDPAAPGTATQAPNEGQAAEAPPPEAPTPAPDSAQQPAPQSAADRFQALRQKRLEEARAYQQEQEERQRALEEQRQKEEEERLNKQRQEYASEKEAFLSRFMKKPTPTPTPTPTPSVLDQLDELAAPEEAAGTEAGEGPRDAEEAEEAGQAPDQQAGAEAEVNLDNY